jgi:hypothetical protein
MVQDVEVKRAGSAAPLPPTSALAPRRSLTPPPHGERKGNDGKPIYFDSIDNSAYVLEQAPHSARDSWVYIDGENFMSMRADIGGDPRNPG